MDVCLLDSEARCSKVSPAGFMIVGWGGKLGWGEQWITKRRIAYPFFLQACMHACTCERRAQVGVWDWSSQEISHSRRQFWAVQAWSTISSRPHWRCSSFASVAVGPDWASSFLGTKGKNDWHPCSTDYLPIQVARQHIFHDSSCSHTLTPTHTLSLSLSHTHTHTHHASNTYMHTHTLYHIHTDRWRVKERRKRGRKKETEDQEIKRGGQTEMGDGGQRDKEWWKK